MVDAVVLANKADNGRENAMSNVNCKGEERGCANQKKGSDSESNTVDGWPFKNKDTNNSTSATSIHSRVSRDSEVYNMAHPRRGKAIIFNHVNFQKMTARKGSEKDCNDLTQTLSRFGFEVHTYPDPSVKKITSTLKSVAEEDHTDADCLVVVAMSHGQSGYLHAYDDMYSVEMLWGSFIAEKCPTLIGKPKLFFIQACRGSQLDAGATIMHETDSIDTYTIPSYADIMVAYSTYDGFFSWRNPDTGSWFIQALCYELNLNGDKRDLGTLMTFVNRRVAIEYESYVPQDKNLHKKRQIPSVVSMLTRLVYLGQVPVEH
ncbi:caspase-1-like [Hylaeus anthracinus]|uniref:caspase-1-like n=1 Tax=Hylaeus anthracinus TaxID=313031 RepID=UPI0023B8A232|nr:caspase-1-like [Hylaeus anthracinus]